MRGAVCARIEYTVSDIEEKVDETIGESKKLKYERIFILELKMPV